MAHEHQVGGNARPAREAREQARRAARPGLKCGNSSRADVVVAMTAALFCGGFQSEIVCLEAGYSALISGYTNHPNQWADSI